ncbi:MAG: hypothetical protein NT027_09560 [Proteobacteria bacterium]|nr:hypothetical protein [Pseudomonadota bacterium]
MSSFLKRILCSLAITFAGTSLAAMFDDTPPPPPPPVEDPADPSPTEPQVLKTLNCKMSVLIWDKTNGGNWIDEAPVKNESVAAKAGGTIETSVGKTLFSVAIIDSNDLGVFYSVDVSRRSEPSRERISSQSDGFLAFDGASDLRIKLRFGPTHNEMICSIAGAE